MCNVLFENFHGEEDFILFFQVLKPKKVIEPIPGPPRTLTVKNFRPDMTSLEFLRLLDAHTKCELKRQTAQYYTTVVQLACPQKLQHTTARRDGTKLSTNTYDIQAVQGMLMAYNRLEV